MKIIHCSDLHLDSKMEANLNKEKARERKNEILITFQNMVKYANENEVKVIIIAGDLFDKKNVSVKVRNIVRDTIKAYSNIDFLYLKGNHDISNFLENDDEIPKNLKMFENKKWTTYRYENNITIAGIEVLENNVNNIYNSLILNKNDINIVVMHGQESKYKIKDNDEIINLQELKNKNIDYLALGHIHTYKNQNLDNRGEYCYCGCLEGRGFDECGDKGFVLLAIENNSIKKEFIKIAQRTLHEIRVNVQDLESTSQIENEIEKKIVDITKESLVKIVLEGNVSIDSEIDVEYLAKKYNQIFYFAKIYNETKLAINYMDYENDASLKGEFIRLVMEQDKLTKEEKDKIILTGIKALSGEEIN